MQLGLSAALISLQLQWLLSCCNLNEWNCPDWTGKFNVQGGTCKTALSLATQWRLYQRKGRLILHACSQTVLQHQPPHSSQMKLETPAFSPYEAAMFHRPQNSHHPPVNLWRGQHDNYMVCLVQNENCGLNFQAFLFFFFSSSCWDGSHRLLSISFVGIFRANLALWCIFLRNYQGRAVDCWLSRV